MQGGHTMEKDPGNDQVTEESLRKLIREQKRMNSEMLAELEQIKAAPLPISHDIQYINPRHNFRYSEPQPLRFVSLCRTLR